MAEINYTTTDVRDTSCSLEGNTIYLVVTIMSTEGICAMYMYNVYLILTVTADIRVC